MDAKTRRRKSTPVRLHRPKNMIAAREQTLFVLFGTDSAKLLGHEENHTNRAFRFHLQSFKRANDL
jgi:hypothetical protein